MLTVWRCIVGLLEKKEGGKKPEAFAITISFLPYFDGFVKSIFSLISCFPSLRSLRRKDQVC